MAFLPFFALFALFGSVFCLTFNVNSFNMVTGDVEGSVSERNGGIIPLFLHCGGVSVQIAEKEFTFSVAVGTTECYLQQGVNKSNTMMLDRATMFSDIPLKPAKMYSLYDELGVKTPIIEKEPIRVAWTTNVQFDGMKRVWFQQADYLRSKEMPDKFSNKYNYEFTLLTFGHRSETLEKVCAEHNVGFVSGSLTAPRKMARNGVVDTNYILSTVAELYDHYHGDLESFSEDDVWAADVCKSVLKELLNIAPHIIDIPPSDPNLRIISRLLRDREELRFAKALLITSAGLEGTYRSVSLEMLHKNVPLSENIQTIWVTPSLFARGHVFGYSLLEGFINYLGSEFHDFEIENEEVSFMENGKLIYANLKKLSNGKIVSDVDLAQAFLEFPVIPMSSFQTFFSNFYDISISETIIQQFNN
eukprot:TRINITY_DN1451_c0_g1_i1.p1 TRINITY_DN1451_c0_g1~~TRINITY_DN1451_c0_g1_i1.p1  ORF type:complete len:417 (-),score=83.24 TRINITY_DN1451_c0_g1_i1:1001-2251(-)